MSYRSLSPITGYTGHIPGEKWVVGTNARRSRSWHRKVNGIEVGERQKFVEGRGIEKEGRKGRRRRKNMEADEEMMMEEEEMMMNEIERGMKLENEVGRKKEDEDDEEEKGRGGDEEGVIEEEMRMMASKYSNSNEEMHKIDKTKRIIQQILATTSIASLPPQSTSSSGERSKNSSSRKSAKTTSRSVGISQSLDQEEEANSSTRTMSPANEKKGERENGQMEGRHRAMDAFANIQPGWWSEGQALKNLRAHKKAIERGEWGGKQRKSEPTILAYANEQGDRELASSSRREAESAPLETPTKCPIGDGMQSAEEEYIPTPGYSGHLTELYQTSVGKPFGMAAKESKLRQKRYQDELLSNGRGRTFLSSSGSSAGKAKSKERPEEEEDDDQKISPY